MRFDEVSGASYVKRGNASEKQPYRCLDRSDGGIRILQGLNLAWGSLSRSFMQGDQHWAFYGAIMLIVGVCEIVWSNTRR
jgi:hypothetical protein